MISVSPSGYKSKQFSEADTEFCERVGAVLMFEDVGGGGEVVVGWLIAIIFNNLLLNI